MSVPEPRFADIIVPRHLHRTFTYGVPAHLRPSVRMGSLVRVPLGASTVTGVVVALPPGPPPLHANARAVPIRVRDVLAMADESADAIAPDLLELSRAVADHYLAPWGQCLRLILPAISAAPKTPRARRRQSDGGDAGPAPSGEALPLPEVPAPPWWPRFAQALAERRHETVLVEGPLPSRWAVLLQAADAALALHRPVLLVSPEIRRAEALAALSRRRWPDRVALLHSELPPAERARVWRRIQGGAADVVVGTRSAVFAPLHAPGLLCVDDEDDPALKEEPEPHYHARDVAAMRASQHGAVLLLGTAHASVETRHHVGIPQFHAVPPVPRAAVQVADLRRTPPRTLLSEAMLAGLRAALAAGAGAVLFANRKGFAAALHCRDCGASPSCSRCSVPLTLYRKASRIACRYCGDSQTVPDTCPSCHSSRIEPVGTGTERLEEEVRRQLPDARVGRLDRETARTAGQEAALRLGLAEKTLDILIGTQLLFQDLPMPPVGFVGIPYADAGLHRADFRSAERTYHALRDAVALARADGQVVLQTALPDHHVIAAIARDDPEHFYGQELAFRRALGYPPFARLISLRVSGKTEATVRAAAERWAAALKERGKHGAGTAVLGPIPASVERIRGRHRWQILVKSADGEQARRIVKASLEKMECAKESRALKFDVDVDPIELG